MGPRGVGFPPIRPLLGGSWDLVTTNNGLLTLLVIDNWGNPYRASY